MTPRTRRLAEALLLLVAVLFVGRWTAEFVSERWWQASVAPGAAAFYTTWSLVGLALDTAAIVTASVWFALHALIVARAIASVQITHRLGDLQLREAVPTRMLLLAAIASGVVLGMLAGSGAHAWREPIVLAWQGVTYNVTDPLLHVDVGTLVAQLPAWELGARFLGLLAIVGFAFCAALYGAIGALRISGRTLYVHADARRHLGGLLACGALVIALMYVLAPYRLAVAPLGALGLDALLVETRTADLVAGLAIAAAGLSTLWALRGRNSLLIAGWLLLAIGAFTDRFLVPAWVQPTPYVPARMAEVRKLDGLAWGIQLAERTTPIDSLPQVTSLWDEVLLARMAERGGGTLIAASRSILATATGPMPVWLVATPAIIDSNRVDLIAVSDSGVTRAGDPLLLRGSTDSSMARPVWRAVNNIRVRSDGAPWAATQSGVDARGPIRRLVLAWARQAPGILGDRLQPAVDWHLDPAERAASILPMFSWTEAELMLVGGEPTWVLVGFASAGGFPLTPRTRWRDDRPAGVTPAVIADIDPVTGGTHFYSDPSASPLGLAWAQVIGPLVAPATAIPPALRGAVPYPAEWLEAQANVLNAPEWNAGRSENPLAGGPSAPAPLWIDGRVPGEQIVLGDLRHGAAASVITGWRAAGTAELALVYEEPTGNGDRPEFAANILRGPEYAHLRDSTTAGGDSIATGPTRWHVGRTTLSSWQPVFALSRRTSPALLWVSTSIGDRRAGGRTAAEAWSATARIDRDTGPHGPDNEAVLATARAWLERADSAFKRGDLTAFGRAFEALRSTLQRPSH